MKAKILMTVMFVVMVAGQSVWASEFDHKHWNQLLQQHVVSENGGKSTMVDYAAFQAKRDQLKQYLDALSAVRQAEFDGWSKDDQLAFLINAYNAWTVELILTAWPELESIRDLGSLFTSPWEKAFIPLLGQEISLDDIEHGLIRGSDRYEDPRIHFAVNCASIGCPALRAEAFTGAMLDAQLREQTEGFLSDSTRNRLHGGALELSSIFKWYRDDFEKGWHGYESLEQFVLDYAESLQLTASAKAKLAEEKMPVDFLKYDWNLNTK